MTPQRDFTLAQLALPQDIVPLFREFSALSSVQESTVRSLMKEYANQADTLAEPSGSPSDLDVSALPTSPKHLLGCRIRALEGLFEPIRRLPPEILIEIFRLCQSEDDQYDSTHSSQTTPFTLASVCSFWRETVISSPILWSQVRITGRGDLGTTALVSCAQAHAVTLSLDRIGDRLPWSLAVDLGQDTPVQAPGVGLSKIVLHPATRHLQQLHIHADSPITGVEGQSFPGLKSLVVHWEPSTHHFYALESVFPEVPKLTKLVAVNVISLNPYTDKLPWSNITHVFVEGVSMEKFRSVFIHCINMQEGCFSVDVPSDNLAEFMSNQASKPSYAFPHLKKLTFLNKPPFDNECQILDLAQLEELNVVWGDAPLPEWSFTETLRLVGSAQRLTLAGRVPVQAHKNIFRLLDVLPLVKHLRIDVDCNIDALLQYLTYHASRPRLQLLQTLDIAFRRIPSAEVIAALRNALSSRAPHRKGDHSPNASLSPGLTHVTIRIPKSSSSAKGRLEIGTAAREVGFGDEQVAAIEERKSFPLINPPRRNAGGYRHWDDGLMDFLNPKGLAMD